MDNTKNGSSDDGSADSLIGGTGDDDFYRGKNSSYVLGDAGSVEDIWSVSEGDVLDFSAKFQSLTFLLKGMNLYVGLAQKPNTPGTEKEDFESYVWVHNTTGLAKIIGGSGKDIFRVWATAAYPSGSVTHLDLDGGKGERLPSVEELAVDLLHHARSQPEGGIQETEAVGLLDLQSGASQQSHGGRTDLGKKQITQTGDEE